MSENSNFKMPELATLSIHDLWCLGELFETLREAAMNFCNQPRLNDTSAADFADDLWGVHYAGICEDIYKEALQRQPANGNEAEWRAWAIINYLSKTDDFRGVMDAAVDALEARRKHAA